MILSKSDLKMYEPDKVIKKLDGRSDLVKYSKEVRINALRVLEKSGGSLRLAEKITGIDKSNIRHFVVQMKKYNWDIN